MKKLSEIDYSKLLGFESIGGLVSGDIDFQDERSPRSSAQRLATIRRRRSHL
jgi:hypothetical protein